LSGTILVEREAWTKEEKSKANERNGKVKGEEMRK